MSIAAQTSPAASMHVTRWGADEPRVVMVHGSAQGSTVSGHQHFARQQGLVKRGWQVVLPDRPGHGLSPDPGRPDDADADGELVAQLLSEGDEDGAHLVGHSFGGCVALAAAAQRPGAVRSLTLIEPAMAPLATDVRAVRGFLVGIVSTLFLSFSAITRIRRFVKLVNIPEEIRGGSSPAELKRMGQALLRMKLPSRQALQQQIATVRAAGIPVLVVSGGWSPAFDAISGRVSEMVGGRHLVIRSPHHFPQQVSEEFNDALVAFMRKADVAQGHGQST